MMASFIWSIQSMCLNVPHIKILKIVNYMTAHD